MNYDIIIIGAGHAGCEAALAAARLGSSVALVTAKRDSIAAMSCNPAIGGIAKGHMVREIDALGGEMGRAADATGIQFRRLNMSRGPAVRSTRCQSDRHRTDPADCYQTARYYEWIPFGTKDAVDLYDSVCTRGTGAVKDKACARKTELDH